MRVTYHKTKASRILTPYHQNVARLGRPFLFVFLAGFLVSLTGCAFGVIVPAPHTSKKSPVIDGRVIDVQGQPVVGAVIELENRKTVYRDGHELIIGAKTKTQADGTFHLSAKHNVHFLRYANASWGWYIPGGLTWTGKLTVSHKGFVTTAYESKNSTNGQVGDLQLPFLNSSVK